MRYDKLSAIGGSVTASNITFPTDLSDGDAYRSTDDSKTPNVVVEKVYHVPPAPTQNEITAKNRAAFDQRRAELIATNLCDQARARISDEKDRNVSLTQKYVDRVVYLNALLDLPETQTDFATAIADADFDLATDIDWPTEPA